MKYKIEYGSAWTNTETFETNDMKTEKGSSSSTANTVNNNNNNAIRHTDAMVTTTSTTATAAATTTMTSTNHDIAMSNSNRPRRTRKIPKKFQEIENITKVIQKSKQKVPVMKQQKKKVPVMKQQKKKVNIMKQPKKNVIAMKKSKTMVVTKIPKTIAAIKKPKPSNNITTTTTTTTNSTPDGTKARNKEVKRKKIILPKKIYECKICQFASPSRYNYNLHLNTRRHKTTVNPNYISDDEESEISEDEE